MRFIGGTHLAVSPAGKLFGGYRAMNKYLISQTQHQNRVPEIRNALSALTLLLFAHGVSSASISGHTVDAEGNKLAKVSVCLSMASTPDTCERVRWTDRRGGYTFNGLKAGNAYIVTVNGDSSANNRKFEQHANYVWEPRNYAVSVNSKNEKLTVDGFVGKFNFSNFQRIISLGAADFPELASIDLAGSYVGLKVFINSTNIEKPPETIFLGRVSDGEKLKIRASVPLASSSIKYEIFSANLALSGSIELAQ